MNTIMIELPEMKILALDDKQANFVYIFTTLSVYRTSSIVIIKR